MNERNIENDKNNNWGDKYDFYFNNFKERKDQEINQRKNNMIKMRNRQKTAKLRREETFLKDQEKKEEELLKKDKYCKKRKEYNNNKEKEIKEFGINLDKR